jgi:nitrate/nitrite transport system ATP-binding protein
LEVGLARPRDRIALAQDPVYIACRSEVLRFLYQRQHHPAMLEDAA